MRTTASMAAKSPALERVPASGEPAKLQRKCACGGTPGPTGECEECRKKRLERAAPKAAPPIVHEVLRCGGQPLDGRSRALMESRFGHNFSQVRVHTDARAAESARAVNALAYTVGRNVVFAAGEYSPETGRGRKLLTHELTHVVQQQALDGSASIPANLMIGASQDAAEVEASAIARQTLDRGADLASQIRRSPTQLRRTETSDCSVDEAKEVMAAVTAARSVIVTAVNNIPKQSQFQTYFGPSASSHSSSISGDLLLISKGISDVTIECESPGGWFHSHFCPEGGQGYTRPVPAFFGLGNIHVCQPAFHNSTPAQRVGTVVHEGSHRFIGTGDKAYYTLSCAETPETRALTDDDRRDNADSFGCFIQSLA